MNQKITGMLLVLTILLNLFSFVRVSAAGIIVSASISSGIKPEITLDGKVDKFWKAEANGDWIAYDFGEMKAVNGLEVNWYDKIENAISFDVEVSKDGSQWECVYSGISNTDSKGFTSYGFTKLNVKMIRLVDTSNDGDDPINFSEIKFNFLQTNSSPQSNTGTIDKPENEIVKKELDLNPYTKKTPSDLIGNKNQREIEILLAFGILENQSDGTFAADRKISRGDMAKVITKMYGLDTLNHSQQQVFKDVPTTHGAADYINFVSDMGIMTGDENNNFRPDEEITFQQAVKIMLSISGYSIIAEQNGGYPLGYLNAAASNGFLKGMDLSMSSFKKQDLALLIYNTLNTDMMKRVSYGDTRNFEIQKDRTVASEMLGIYKEDGVVTANSITTLSGPSSLRDDYIKINDQAYKIKDGEAKNYIGYDVDFYYRDDENSDDKEILYISVARSTSTLTLRTEDIVSVTSAGQSKIVFKYEDENNQLKSAAVNRVNYTFINGISEKDYSLNDLKPRSGYVVLVNPDGGGDYNNIYVTSFDIYVANDIVASSKLVFDKYADKKLDLDDSDQNKKIFFIKDKQFVKFDDIKRFDILSVAAAQTSNGREMINVYISSNKITASISEIKEDNGRDIFLNDHFYKVAYNYTGNLDTDDTGDFYIDVMGNVAAFELKEQAVMQYGYLVDGVFFKGAVVTSRVKLFLTSGEMKTYNLARRLTVDGYTDVKPSDLNEKNTDNIKNASFRSYTALVDKSSTDPNQWSFKNQLIEFKTNSQGEVNMIDTSYKGSNEDEDTLRLDAPRRTRKYRKSGATLAVSGDNSMFRLLTDAKILGIPIDEMNNDKLYKVFGVADISDSSNNDVEIFNADELLCSGLVVKYLSTKITRPAISNSAKLLLVDRVTKFVDEKGDTLYKIYGAQDGKPSEFECFDYLEDTVKNLKQGDVIQISLFHNGKISNITTCFKIEEPHAYNQSSTTFDTEKLLMYGEVKDKLDKSITLLVLDSSSKPVIKPFDISVSPISMFESSKKKVSAITYADIKKGDKLYLRIRYAKVEDIVVFR